MKLGLFSGDGGLRVKRPTVAQQRALDALTVVVTDDGRTTDVLERPDLSARWWDEDILRIRGSTLNVLVRRGWAERGLCGLRITRAGLDTIPDLAPTVAAMVSRREDVQ